MVVQFLLSSDFFLSRRKLLAQKGFLVQEKKRYTNRYDQEALQSPSYRKFIQTYAENLYQFYITIYDFKAEKRIRKSVYISKLRKN